LWQHSLTVAAHARAIAAAEQAEAKVRDESFVTGLLHDAGKVVLAANFAAQYAEVLRMVRDRGLELLVAEEEVFGANHADVGGYLLGLWGLPAPVVEAIALHHNPARSLGKTFSPLTAVHVANALACCPAELSEGRGTAPVDTNYLAELGLVHRLPAWQAAASPSAAEAA
jgi:HD-like signal output (HDOD) protein